MYDLQIMHELDALKTRVVTGGRQLFGPAWGRSGAEEFCDPFGRLYMVHAGEGQVIHSERLIHLRPGYLFVIPPHMAAKYRCPKRMDLSWVHFHATLHGCLEPFSFFGWDPMVRIPRGLPAASLMGIAIKGERCSASPAEALAADGAVRLLLASFVGSGIPYRAAIRFEPVFRYVDEKLGAKITLKDLAVQVHLHPTYFSNRFVEVTGITPMQFVRQRRIERVAERLRSGSHSLEELANDCGFSDAFHLSKTFKRLMGVSPRVYRTQSWREDDSGLTEAR